MIRYLQPEDVAKLFYGTINRATTLEEATQVSDLILQQCDLDPDDYPEGAARELREEYLRHLAMMAVAAKSSMQTCILLFPHIAEPSSVEISAVLEMAERTSGVIEPGPVRAASVIPRIPDVEGLFLTADPYTITCNGSLINGIRAAITAQHVQDGVDFRKAWDLTDILALHPQFTKDVDRAGFLAQPTAFQKLLRAAVETVQGKRLEDTHALRVGRGPEDPQRVRHSDGAKAWRRDVDYEYHLHYWEIDGRIELASVRPHNDYSIPE